MCTALTYMGKDVYFGRNLDFNIRYGEEIVIMPKRYSYSFCNGERFDEHYSVIGVAHIEDEIPLYYDAINEKGVGVAGLNFEGNAYYHEEIDIEGVDNVAVYEFILWILFKCNSVASAKEVLGCINITNRKFNDKLGVASLHWIISDRKESVTVESTVEGLKVYDNGVGVLTNNPSFDKQIFALNNYRHLSVRNSKNLFLSDIKLDEYSRGMGALGLPGDNSSQSRFVRATFNKFNALRGSGEKDSVVQFFHILDSVAQIKGCCIVEEEEYEYTIYSSCYNLVECIFYFSTYISREIRGIRMNNYDINGMNLYRISME